MNKIEWNPQDDGFVFTAAELDALIRREDRVKVTSNDVKYYYKPAA